MPLEGPFLETHRSWHFVLNPQFAIDANADWTPEISLQYLDVVLRGMKEHVYMLEQPFPVKIVRAISPRLTSFV